MDDVVSSAAKNVTHLSPQSQANRDPRLRSIAVDGLASTKPNDVRLLLRARDVGGDDVDVVAATTSLACKEVNVLADPAKVRIVVLRHESDAERPIVPNYRKMWQLRERGMSKSARIP